MVHWETLELNSISHSACLCFVLELIAESIPIKISTIKTINGCIGSVGVCSIIVTYDFFRIRFLIRKDCLLNDQYDVGFDLYYMLFVLWFKKQQIENKSFCIFANSVYLFATTHFEISCWLNL